jgi:3-dehydroquinate dehydratase-2
VSAKILVLHGVNLNMFGKRDPAIYGTITLAQIDEKLRALARELDVELETFQTNGEKEMCERVHRALAERFSAVIINAGAWTHYSYAIRDALEILAIPVIEVHMSDIHAREPFRRHSVFEGLSRAQLTGQGVDSYLQGLRAAVAAAATKS